MIPGRQRTDKVHSRRTNFSPVSRLWWTILSALQKEWLLESRRKTKDSHINSGGALFINMASGCIDCVFQAHLNMHETIHVKEEYEMRCQDVGIMPQEYISNNGSAFTSRQYTAHLCDFHHFAGVGAHHHMVWQKGASNPSCPSPR